MEPYNIDNVIKYHSKKQALENDTVINSINDRKTQYYNNRKCNNRFRHMSFSGGNRNSSYGNYSLKIINMTLFLNDNIYTNFNHTKENTGSENHHIVLNDKFEYLKNSMTH